MFEEKKINKNLKNNEDILDLKISFFIEYFDSDYKIKNEFTEKDFKFLIDSSLISLFGNINSFKIGYSINLFIISQYNYSLKPNHKDFSIIEETKRNVKDKIFLLKTKRW